VRNTDKKNLVVSRVASHPTNLTRPGLEDQGQRLSAIRKSESSPARSISIFRSTNAQMRERNRSARIRSLPPRFWIACGLA
jgi:hypothetical protein